MAKKNEDIAAEVRLPEIYVTASIEPYLEKMRKYYYSIPGDVYDRNDDLFRQAIRFMQRHHDLKGEAHVFNKCTGAAVSRVTREFVIPVLLGTVALPVAIEVTPALMIYTKASTWIRIGVNWSTQAMLYGVNRVDYVSVIAEGFSPGGSALSALIEVRPFAVKEEQFKIAFVNKSPEDTSVDLVMQLTGAYFYKGAYGMVMEGLENDVWAKKLITGFGTNWYAFYQATTRSVSKEAKDRIKKHKYGKSERDK